MAARIKLYPGAASWRCWYRVSVGKWFDCQDCRISFARIILEFRVNAPLFV